MPTKSKKKKNLSHGFIDLDSGTVLGTNLAYVVATDEEFEDACMCDSDAFDLAKKKGKQVPVEAIAALYDEDTGAFAKAMKWSRELDNDGQVVFYTGHYEKKTKR